MNNWNIHEIWNTALGNETPREVKPRDYIYASELGKSHIDIYLAMTGIEPSNRPNERALRKFEAGNIWEAIIKIVLLRAGILIAEQQTCNTDKVHGRLDFIAGGQIDWEKAQRIAETEFNWLPDKTRLASQEVIRQLSEKHKDGLKPIVLDAKSVSSFAFESILKTGKPFKRNILQIYHYLKCTGMDEGHLIYISKDDARMFTGLVTTDEETEELYNREVETIYNHYKNKQIPPKDLEIIWENGKFSNNLSVQYSSYLTLVYGYKDETEFRAMNSKKVAGWNSTLKRVVSGAKMTPLNLTRIEQISALYNYEKLVEEKKMFLKNAQPSDKLPVDIIT